MILYSILGLLKGPQKHYTFFLISPNDEFSSGQINQIILNKPGGRELHAFDGNAVHAHTYV